MVLVVRTELLGFTLKEFLHRVLGPMLRTGTEPPPVGGRVKVEALPES